MKRPKDKFEKVTGRIVANTGDFAVCELTDGNYTVTARGYHEFVDLFPEEFLHVLPVGQRIQCEQNERAVRFLHPLSEPQESAK